MIQKRVIFTFEDGSRRYATHNGELLMWDDEDIAALQENIAQYGFPVCTSDFMQWDVNHKSLRSRFPKAKILRIVAVDYETVARPPKPDIAF